ncbi:class I SAM-dependent methyltransferase [Streptomyces rhizosphaerihabitans]|uniref:class I SAM-dependent methyltransferase n=1 Tax=Streptomyces rhizosphaerihabitans TaxID=1266770 RepID=UPI0021C00280|nr:class I SAM-dependent methyltransferase [Streptomyces rhizosphaerihabitans]MCT9008092.1 class I SAM-dependent methyltransferase [Streptomyces rhizosphaerihabitans]
MFTPQGPTLRELAVQALSSIEHGYDLLSPKFDHTPFRTPDAILEAVGRALAPIGPFGAGLDLCCGTGAGMEVLRDLCRESVTGVDISTGMLTVGRSRFGADDSLSSAVRCADDSLSPAVRCAGGGPSSAARRDDGPPSVAWVRGDARALPFAPAFDLVVSFGAFGHFLPRELPGLFAGVHAVLRPGGRFAFPVMAPPRPGSPWYWALLGFDTVMRVRNAVRRPTFVMYYRAFRLDDVERELARAGFRTELHALTEFGRRRDGSPRARMVVATRDEDTSVVATREGTSGRSAGGA